ncbi:MAG: hypothetical protein ICV68_04190 [Pyrinomonadaceae bacterium]|nr:hypothetical protein [Pyrinomonadaceae bacterium]
MKTLHAPLRQRTRRVLWCSATLMLVLLSMNAAAQSTNIEFPTPVRTNEISGTIAPRDVGDARLTRYFYSLSGTNGDLTVTVESRNLNGDVDLFTAGTLRPLVKLSMYAGSAASTTSKTIYFKREEALILRVEARSPNDFEGSFKVRFDGAFAPFTGEAREPEPINALPPTATGGKTRRVTATGARIDEPVVEAVAKTPETESAPTTPAPETPITENPPEATQPTATETEPAPRPTARPTRTRRPRRPATRTARNRPTPTTTPEQPPAPPEEATASTETPTQPEPAPLGPRLIIETKDGLRVERYMATVRRVTVDNGQIVVILKSGKVERQPMTNVLKMSIEP